MTKQPTVLPRSPSDSTDTSSMLWKQGASTDPLTTSLSQEESIQTQQPVQCIAPHNEDYLDVAASEDKSEPVAKDDEQNQSEDTAEDGVVPEERAPQQAVVEYEYMDIQTDPKPVPSSSEEKAASSHDTGKKPCSPGKVKSEPTEDVVYQNMGEIPALKLNSAKELSYKAKENYVTCQPVDYEDMSVCGKVHESDDQTEYQNIPAKGRKLSGEVPHSTKLRAFRGACAGPDEKNGNASFDNPDYWHSRLFHKPDAVCT